MENIDYMREAGNLAARTLDYITPYVVEGITTGELDKLIYDYTIKNKAIPAPLNYEGFPKSCCISINHIVCHGIPGKKKLINGDILNIDVTPILNDWHGDCSRMFFIGKPSIKAKLLVETTYKAMMKTIEIIKPGITVGDIGYTIESFIGKKYGIVKEFGGHGVGREFHMNPKIPFIGKPGTGEILKEGMFITIEPMINIGKPDVKILSDGWTVVTRDRTLSAQYEHTVAIIEDGYEILTL